MSSKRKAKPTSSKGKKGIDEGEKVLTGAGWTLAATTKFLELQSIDEQLHFLFQMFSTTEDNYKTDSQTVFTIDFHFANALYCIEQKFNAIQTQFVCRTLNKLLDTAIQAVRAGAYERFDELRSQLYNQFHQAFKELNVDEYHFSQEETRNIISFVNTAFLRPLRLIVHPFYVERQKAAILEQRKVFQPAPPVPLSECIEQIPAVPEELEFSPISIPHVDHMNLQEVKEMIQKYTEDTIATIDKRYDMLDQAIAKLQETPDNTASRVSALG